MFARRCCDMKKAKVNVKIRTKEGDYIITAVASADFSMAAKVKRLYNEILRESELIKVKYKTNDKDIMMEYEYRSPIVGVNNNVGSILDVKGGRDLVIDLSKVREIIVIPAKDLFDYTIKLKLHSGEIIFSGILE